MKPIITSLKEALQAGLYEGEFFVKVQTGEAMFLFPYSNDRIDLDKMLVTENWKDKKAHPELPELETLVETGQVIEVHVYREYDVYVGYIDELSNSRISQIIDDFKEHGFNVTREAILHNYNAWTQDFKSAFRDEKNGYHVFSPCGCNPFVLRVSSLEDGLTWQNTYIA